jgi:hypothetical protein
VLAHSFETVSHSWLADSPALPSNKKHQMPTLFIVTNLWGQLEETLKDAGSHISTPQD